jgi:hypothetical protein
MEEEVWFSIFNYNRSLIFNSQLQNLIDSKKKTTKLDRRRGHPTINSQKIWSSLGAIQLSKLCRFDPLDGFAGDFTFPRKFKKSLDIIERFITNLFRISKISNRCQNFFSNMYPVSIWHYLNPSCSSSLCLLRATKH